MQVFVFFTRSAWIYGLRPQGGKEVASLRDAEALPAGCHHIAPTAYVVLLRVSPLRGDYRFLEAWGKSGRSGTVRYFFGQVGYFRGSILAFSEKRPYIGGCPVATSDESSLTY